MAESAPSVKVYRIAYRELIARHRDEFDKINNKLRSESTIKGYERMKTDSRNKAISTLIKKYPAEFDEIHSRLKQEHNIGQPNYEGRVRQLFKDGASYSKIVHAINVITVGFARKELRREFHDEYVKILAGYRRSNNQRYAYAGDELRDRHLLKYNELRANKKNELMRILINLEVSDDRLSSSDEEDSLVLG